MSEYRVIIWKYGEYLDTGECLYIGGLSGNIMNIWIQVNICIQGEYLDTGREIIWIQGEYLDTG